MATSATHPSPEDRNLFLVLGKYVERQDENLLTQSFVLLFNRVSGFRRDFCALLARRSGGRLYLDPDAVLARSQVHFQLSRGTLIADIAIGPSNKTPSVLIEVKLGAGLGPRQLQKYREIVARHRSISQFVVITKNAVENELYASAPPGTVWLSWSLVAEIARRTAKRAPRLERLLVEDFLEMIKTKNIPMLPPMRADEWRRLAMFSRFAMRGPQHAVNLHPNTISAVDTALQCLAILRDSAWESEFKKSDGWRPFLEGYKYSEETEPFVTIGAGYSRRVKKKSIRRSFLTLELECRRKPRLVAFGGLLVTSAHKDYEAGGPSTEYYAWAPRDTAKVFRKPIYESIEAIHDRLSYASRRFQRSRYNV